MLTLVSHRLSDYRFSDRRGSRAEEKKLHPSIVPQSHGILQNGRAIGLSRRWVPKERGDETCLMIPNLQSYSGAEVSRQGMLQVRCSSWAAKIIRVLRQEDKNAPSAWDDDKICWHSELGASKCEAADTKNVTYLIRSGVSVQERGPRRQGIPVPRDGMMTGLSRC